MTEIKHTVSKQTEMPFAVVMGQPITAPPEDLYIPPDALEVFLDAFEGPLDLLLYLTKRQNLDILSLPVAEITAQYMRYIDLMQELKLGLAAEYLLMAAMLAEIKSRLLLPRASEEEEEEDPRAELIKKLLEYERFKKAAEQLDTLPRLERDIFEVNLAAPLHEVERPQPQVEPQDLILAFHAVIERAKMFASHHIEKEPLSVRERMVIILERLQGGDYVEFSKFFDIEEGRAGVIVTMIAILELLKEQVIECTQTEFLAPIYIVSSGFEMKNQGEKGDGLTPD